VTEVLNSATKRKSMTRVFEKIVFQMPLLRKAPPRSTAMWFSPFLVFQKAASCRRVKELVNIESPLNYLWRKGKIEKSKPFFLVRAVVVA